MEYKFSVLISLSILVTASSLDISNILVDKYALDLSNRNLTAIDKNILQNATSTVHKIILDDNTGYDVPYEDAVLEDNHFQTFHCIRCNISRIFKETFAKLPHLREIVIQENPLWAIHPDAFKENPLLRHLDLRQNKLKSFNRMGVLNHMRNLMIIHLSHNDFSLNVKYPIIHMSYMVRFDCEDCKIDLISPEAFSGIGTLYHLNLRNNQITRFNLTVPGLRSLDLSHNPVNLTGIALKQPDLETFICNHCSTNVLDSGIFSMCTDLLTVEMRHCGVEMISDHAFRSNRFLSRLELDGNRLSRIPGRLIKMDSMEHLCFDYNPIRGTPDDWKLMTLYFVRGMGDACAVRQNSTLVAQLMHTVQPEGVRLVRWHNFRSDTVDLSCLNITFVFPDYFQTSHDTFSKLVMDGNSLFNFQSQVPFTFYEQLEEFQCNGCGIDAIYVETFSYTPHMRRLELKNNKITHIALADFHHNVALQTLILDANPIHLLYGCASLHFRHLDVLLPSNFLPKEDIHIKVLPSLATLTCRDCGIGILYENTFNHTPNIRKLNLEGHNLVALRGELNLPASTEEVNFLGNLTEFPYQFINSSQHLKTLCINYTLINATAIAAQDEMQVEAFIAKLEEKTCAEHQEIDGGKKVLINEIRRKLGEFRDMAQRRKLAKKLALEKLQNSPPTSSVSTVSTTAATLPTLPRANRTTVATTDASNVSVDDEVETIAMKSNETFNLRVKENLEAPEKAPEKLEEELDEDSKEIQHSSLGGVSMKEWLAEIKLNGGSRASCKVFFIAIIFSVVFNLF